MFSLKSYYVTYDVITCGGLWKVTNLCMRPANEKVCAPLIYQNHSKIFLYQLVVICGLCLTAVLHILVVMYEMYHSVFRLSWFSGSFISWLQRGLDLDPLDFSYGFTTFRAKDRILLYNSCCINCLRCTNFGLTATLYEAHNR